jgi:hypothetical protein
LQEVSVPVRDALIKRCLDAVEWSAAADRGTDVSRTDRGWWGRLLDAFAGVQHIPANAVGGRSEGPDVVYLPTSALQLWDNLHRHRPMHHLIAADFTRFAPEDVLLQGVNAPIVSVTVCTPEQTEYNRVAIPVMCQSVMDLRALVWRTFQRGACSFGMSCTCSDRRTI